jgi:hypothetical protein
MPFLLESMLCFERLSTRFIEIPAVQQPRPEGKSNLSLANKLRFLVPLVRLRFIPKHKVFGEKADGQA